MRCIWLQTVRIAGVLALLVAVSCSPAARRLPGPQRAPVSTQPALPSPSASLAPLLLEAFPAAQLTPPGVLIVKPAGADLAAAPGGAVVSRLRGGVAVPFEAVKAGWAKVLTPCERSFWLPVDFASAAPTATVVLDPGHGGGERGATGPGGLSEKTVNLPVATRAAQRLGAEGIPAILTRYGDYRATLQFRVALAAAAKPQVFVSIHHNADPDGKMDRPGTETYYQYRSADSKRLSGLVYEETFRSLSTLKADWVGDRDAGAKWRLGEGGADYYGILRRAGEARVTASLAELAFVSNPTEEALLQRDDVRALEGEAVARGIVRYLRTPDPGSGFTVPYPRTEPAGPGGGRTGCTDPS